MEIKICILWYANNRWFILYGHPEETVALSRVLEMDAVEVWKIGLGLVVRSRRQQRALSQEVFAHHVGLTRNAIQKLERGVTNLSFESLLKVAAALEVKPADLLRDVDELVSDRPLFVKAVAELEDQRKKGRPPKAGL